MLHDLAELAEEQIKLQSLAIVATPHDDDDGVMMVVLGIAVVDSSEDGLSEDGRAEDRFVEEGVGVEVAEVVGRDVGSSSPGVGIRSLPIEIVGKFLIWGKGGGVGGG